MRTLIGYTRKIDTNFRPYLNVTITKITNQNRKKGKRYKYVQVLINRFFN